MKRAVCFGINAYDDGNALQGCVNGANDMREYFKNAGFDEVTTVTDSAVTVDEFIRQVRYLFQQTEIGDLAVVYYSGHGTWTVDQNADENDGYDEALALYDGTLVDDQVHELIVKNVIPGSHIVFLLDSCFSGTATRGLSIDALTHKGGGRRKFLPPPKRVKRLKDGRTRIRKNRFLSRESMVEVLMSGCSDHEYSYETWFLDGWNGIFTHYLLKALDKGPCSYDTLHSLVSAYIEDTNFPQTPQLEGTRANLERIAFEDDAPEPEPEPEPEPQPGFQCGCVRAVKKWWKTRGRHNGA